MRTSLPRRRDYARAYSLLSRAVKLGRRLPLIGRCLSRLRLQLHAWRARLGAAYAIAGRTEEAKRLLREWEQASADEREEDVEHRALALIYLKLGNKDHALEWPEKGFKARSTTPLVVKVYPFFDEMTSDPRFEELMKKTVGSRASTRE